MSHPFEPVTAVSLHQAMGGRTVTAWADQRSIHITSDGIRRVHRGVPAAARGPTAPCDAGAISAEGPHPAFERGVDVTGSQR
uniref:hypothetical protein n=1 Tax=Lentzea alba TaxID=2714351 RepID=UPI0039BF578E